MNENPDKRNDTSREVDQLREEVAQLRGRLAEKDKGGGQTRETPERGGLDRRTSFSRALLVIGLILLIVAIPVLWMKRTLYSTDGWVQAVGPLAEKEAVQAAVADAVSTEFAQQVDLEAWVQQQLPEESQGLAAPIASLVVVAIRQFTQLIVSSEVFADLWRQANRTSHNLVVAGISSLEAVTGNGGEGFNLDLTPVIERLQQILEERGFAIPLPEDFGGEVALLQPQQLSQIAGYVQALDTAAPWLAALAILGIAASIALARDRRREILSLGVGIVIAGLVLLIAEAIMQWRVVSQVPPDAIFGPEATEASYQAITGGFTATVRAAMLVGLLLWLGAFALGPAHSMVMARQRVLGGIHDLSRGHRPARSELWIGAHHHAIQVGILIAGGIALIIPDQRTVGYVLILTLTVLLLEAAVEFFSRAEPTAAT